MKRYFLLITWITFALGADAKESPNPGSADTSYNIRAAADYLESRNGHALLVYRRNKLVFEEYYNGHTAEKPHRLASGTKSFSGVLAVMAEEDGLLDLDENVADTLTEWKKDPLKSKVTIRQLLSLSSGIQGGDNQNTPSGKVAVAMATSTSEPGASFSYGPIPFQAWGELLRRKLELKEETVEDYMKRRLLDPIGLKPAFWRKDEDDAIQLPAGAFVTAREWAKFGLFVLAGGKWKGDQLVSKKGLMDCFEGSKANPNYGLTFWLNRWDDMPGDLVMAAGRGKQKLYIIPSEELLIVQLAEAQGYNEKAFLDRFFSEPGTAFDNSPAVSENTARREPYSVSANRLASAKKIARLRSMDTNKDNQLSAEEARDWKDFNEADTDGDGIATSREIGVYLRRNTAQ